VSDWALLVGGGFLLYLGAEWFVAGASSLALALRVPQILVGLTVVAYGTSAPEIVVGVQAARAGHGEVALANVLGSNIANVGLILGVAALIRPARVHAALRVRELPMLVLTACVVPLLLLDGSVTRLESLALLMGALLYTWWMVSAARGAAALATARSDARATQDAADSAGAPHVQGSVRAMVTAAAGLVILLTGGTLFVDGAVSLAATLGMSERLVGLTVVALGTSLPELVTSVIAARNGHSDLAVGNVIGSNIFNVLLCLGAAGIAAPLEGEVANLWPDLAAFLIMTLIAAVFIRTERTISRAEGLAALVAYIAFMLATVASS
jgi:cation:H+ antiporter